MAQAVSIALDRVRTDGWFERLGESIGSFQTLCDVIGEQFFAFALIAGARVSSLMIDRFNPDQSLVEFSFGEEATATPESLTVEEFRQRLVARLLSDEDERPPISKLSSDVDLETLQKFIGSRVLLLAPLYGFGLVELRIQDDQAILVAEYEGQTEEHGLAVIREQLLDNVRNDLAQGTQRNDTGTAIDLGQVDAAEEAAAEERWDKVIQLLGSWPMPLAIYWRTPEGQMLPDATRQRIAEGLGLLGSACGKLGDEVQGEEVLRLAVQYAQDGSAAGDIFCRLGLIYSDAERHGEAIGPLRRAQHLWADDAERQQRIMPRLIHAFLQRQRPLSAWAHILEAKANGIPSELLESERKQVESALGEAGAAWHALVG
jgi:hypothetical protein